MENIKDQSGRNLLEWYEREVRIHHYDPVETPPRAPFTLHELEGELLRRLEKFDSLGF